MTNKERLVKTFIDLVSISSPAGKERACADYIIKYLDNLGISWIEDNAGATINGDTGNIIVQLDSSLEKHILFSAHMDTVGPCEKITPIIENGVIKTDGTSVLGGDDKAGVATILEVLHCIKTENIPHPKMTIIFSIAEEIGLKGAKAIDSSLLKGINYGIVLDGSGEIGTAYNSAPYSAKGEIVVKGKSAHSGMNPQDGIHALVVASHAINNLTIGRVTKTSSCNIGKVSGGLANNIIMPELNLSFEARALEEVELDLILKEIDNQFKISCENYGAQYTNTLVKGTPGFRIDPSSPVMQLFEKSTKVIGLPFAFCDGLGGSDANIYNKYGIPTLNISVGMEAIHSTEEYILIDNLEKAAKLLLSILEQIK